MSLIGTQLTSLAQQVVRKGVNAVINPDDTATAQNEMLARKMQQRPQMEYMFGIELPDISIPMAETNISSPNTFDLIDLNSRVFSATTPFKTYEADKNKAGDEKVYTIGSSDMPSMNIVLDEMEDGATTRYILDWQGMAKNSDGTRNMPYEYKRNIRVLRVGRNLADTVVMEYVGAWPNNIEPIVNMVEGEGVTQLKVNFAVDNVLVSDFSPNQLRAAIAETDEAMAAQLLEIESPFELIGDVANKILGSREVNKLFGGF